MSARTRRHPNQTRLLALVSLVCVATFYTSEVANAASMPQSRRMENSGKMLRVGRHQQVDKQDQIPRSRIQPTQGVASDSARAKQRVFEREGPGTENDASMPRPARDEPAEQKKELPATGEATVTPPSSNTEDARRARPSHVASSAETRKRESLRSRRLPTLSLSATLDTRAASTAAAQVEPPTTAPAVNLRTRSDNFDNTVSREKGIIICLHDDIVSMGLSLIRDLRCMGNTELIQVYHCMPNELSPASRDTLTASDPRVEIVDACSYYIERGDFTTATATKFRNWWIKPLALVHTDVQEVVLLDADVIPMQDPTNIRMAPGYTRTGTTFFFDRVIPVKGYLNAPVRGGSNYLRQWVDTFPYGEFNLSGPAPSAHLQSSFAYAGQSCHEQDSSMVLVDKKRASEGKALEVLWYLITKKRFEFEFSWGDKESFWLAFEFAHQEYFFSPWGAAVVSSTPNEDVKNHPDTLCGSLAHFLPVEEEEGGNAPPELLYVNGKALLKALPHGTSGIRQEGAHNWYNSNPSHVTPRQHRRANTVSSARHTRRKFAPECLVGLGSTPLSEYFQKRLLERRVVLMALEANLSDVALRCPQL